MPVAEGAEQTFREWFAGFWFWIRVLSFRHRKRNSKMDRIIQGSQQEIEALGGPINFSIAKVC